MRYRGITMRSRISRKKALTVILCVAFIIPLFFAPGCKKPEPARIIFTVQGELFSDASLVINGKPSGKLVQTLIKKDGKLYIDSIYNITLPPGHRDIPEEDAYTGTLDSLELISGDHTIMLLADDGKFLQIKASVLPGRQLVTYFSDEGVLKWNNEKIKAAPGETVNIKPKN